MTINILNSQTSVSGKYYLSEALANSIFDCLLAIFAVWTVLSHGARILHYSFSDLSVAFSFLLIPLIFIMGKVQISKWFSENMLAGKSETHTLMILAVLMLVGAALALGAIRPDRDDVDYTSQTIYFFTHPEQPLDLLRHDHGLVDIPFHWPIYIFYSLELLCAYIAWLFNIPFLHVFYYFLPVLGGALIPLAWFLAFSKFSHRTLIAALAATVVCVFLSINGSPHRSFGNFAFVRIWQGKTMLMSILTPYFIGLAIDFFRASTLANWLRLTALMISASGITAMAAFYMPFLSIAGVSYWLTQEKRSFKQLAWFFSSYFYLVLIALYFKSVVNKEAIRFHGEDGWPTSFIGQFKLVFIDYLSWPSFAFIIFVALSLILAKKPERRFITYWLAGMIGLFLNPLVFPFLADHFTSFNNYWRLFYLLPFPFAVGFTLVALQDKLPAKPVWSGLAFSGLMLFAVLANTYPNRYSYNYATFAKVNYSFGAYKIFPELHADVAKIIEAAKPGITLAPLTYSSLIPMYTTALPQVAVRYYMLKSLEAGYGRSVAGTEKIRAFKYVSGESTDGLQDAADLLAKKELVNVIVSAKTTAFDNWRAMAESLAKNGFKPVFQNSRFLLFSRDRA